MFARHAQPGWVAWGDESGNDAPRGAASKGYGGGAIERPGTDVPELAKYERLPDVEADALAAELHDMYERLGFSIRDIAAETAFSITRVRALLDRAGADIRPRGAVAVSS